MGDKTGIMPNVTVYSVKKDVSAYLIGGIDAVDFQGAGFTVVYRDCEPGIGRYDSAYWVNEDKSITLEACYYGFGVDTLTIWAKTNADFIYFRNELRRKGELRTPQPMPKISAAAMRALVKRLPLNRTVKHIHTGGIHKVLSHTKAGNVMISAPNYAAGKRSCKAKYLKTL